ncbi:hypothetical protein GCM10010381_12440 [Streptomyces xantholiticus]|nr:hypothetical protein GCM10010381_12440 [Streptomyces xantholiticus]
MALNVVTSTQAIADAIHRSGTEHSVGLPGPNGATSTDRDKDKDKGRGPRGPQGFQGVPGVPGAPGVQGPQGSQGAAGPQGDTGAQGAQGFQGGTGAQGPQGFQGSTGAQGAQGPVGVSGYDVNTTETTCSPGASCVTLVECDPGKVVTGGGVVWEPFVFGVTVSQSGAFADRTGWQAGVQNAADVPVTYEAQAICVNAS